MENKKHSNKFGLPKEYFEEFDDRLFNKLSEELLPKKTGFKIPKGYFSKLDEQIINKITTAETNPNVISIITRNTLLYAASIAAAAILIFSLSLQKKTEQL